MLVGHLGTRTQFTVGIRVLRRIVVDLSYGAWLGAAIVKKKFASWRLLVMRVGHPGSEGISRLRWQESMLRDCRASPCSAGVDGDL